MGPEARDSDETSWRARARELPDRPGVYLFKDDRGRVLYVGKAKSLRDRVAHYLHPAPTEHPKTFLMLDRARDVEVLETETEVDAFLLEARLIKDVQPKYNKELKDGKSFPYLRVSLADDFPLVEVTREPHREGDLYYGPFTDAGSLHRSVAILQEIFRFRTCDLEIRADDPKLRLQRPCLLYFIHRCTAPCAGKVSAETYAEDIDRVRAFLDGNRASLLDRLRGEMKEAAGRHAYEKAADLRDRIRALERLDRKGSFSDRPEGIPMPIRPKDAAAELQRALDLPGVPRAIEGLDIATLAGEETVGGLVTFLDGIPYKDGYRRFRIGTVEGADDYAAIREVTARRFRRLLEGEEVFPDLFLIDGGRGQVGAVAGVLESAGVGIARPGEARPRPGSSGRSLLLLGLAKKEEEIWADGASEPIVLPRTSLSLRLLQHVRDEAHRFARHYHHLLRRKKVIGE